MAAVTFNIIDGGFIHVDGWVTLQIQEESILMPRYLFTVDEGAVKHAHRRLCQRGWLH